MRYVSLLLTFLGSGELLNLDYHIHVTNGMSNVHLSVMNSDLDAAQIQVIDADNASFLDEIQNLINNDKSNQLNRVDCDDFKTMIPATKQVIGDIDGTKTFTFRPIATGDDDAEVYENLHGIANVSSSTDELISITLENIGAFSPSFGSKIHQLSFTIECIALNEHTRVLKTYELILQGSAFWVPFEERMKRTYSNYRLSSPSAVDHDDI